MQYNFFSVWFKKSASKLVLITFFLAVLIQNAFSQGTSSISGTGTVLEVSANSASVVDPYILVSTPADLTGCKVSITGGYVTGATGDILDIVGSLPTGITQSYDNTRGILSFSGTASASVWQELLRRVTLKSTSLNCYPEQRSITFNLGASFLNPLTGHWYEFDATPRTWPAAKAYAATKSYNGRVGYLATITSAAENNYIWKIMSSDAWVGGSDDYLEINAALGRDVYANQAAAEGKYYWVTGPERGMQYSEGNTSPVTLAGAYANWNFREPNNAGAEHYTQLYSANLGRWNDLNNTRTLGTLIEYGDSPDDNIASVVGFTREIKVLGAASGSITGGNINVCTGSNSTTLTLVGNSGAVVQWESSFDNFYTTGTTINNTTNTYTATNVSQTTYYRAIVSCGGGTVYTASVTLTVNATASGNITALNNSICAGGEVNLTLSGKKGDVTKWQISTDNSNWTDIANTTTNLIETLTTAGTYYYRAVVETAGCGAAVNSTAYPITVTSGTPPVGGTMSTATYYGSTSRSGTLTLSGYTGSISKWQSSINNGINWTDISNTAATYSYSNITTTTLYRAVLINGSCGTAYSSNGGVSFLSLPTIASFNPASAAAGESVTITGTNFTNMTSVSFGGTAAASFTIVSPTQIVAVVGLGSSGSITVSNTDVSVSLVGFNYNVALDCPEIDRRNNGNGQASSCAGVDGTPVATNVVGTAYATPPTTSKTGTITFKWSSLPTSIPVITKVWINGVQSVAQVGPPSVTTQQGGFYKIEYCFYTVNLPNAGTYTLEFTDPQTNTVLKRCTFDASSDASASEPTLTTNTLPTTTSLINQTTSATTPTTAQNFTVADTETAAADLVVSASSSNTTLVPDANITLGGSGASRNVVVTAVSGQYGSATVTLTVTDAQGGTATTTYTVTVTDPTCSPFSITDFQLNGGATAASSIITLTPAQGNKFGGLWNKNKVYLDKDFDISSKVYLGNNDGGADGMTFVLQNQSISAGTVGGGVGYAGITPSFAVEFDTYYNGSFEPVQDHIAIIKNGVALGVHNSYATPYEVQMEDGQWHAVRFVWTASTKNFQVYYEGVKRFDVTVDLKASIFNNANFVYWGFVAATGGANNLQQVDIGTYCYVPQTTITPKAGTNNAAAAVTFCAGADVVLEASSAASYKWYKDGVLLSNTTQSYTATETGSYTVETVSTNGAITTLSDAVEVTVGTAPSFSYATSSYAFFKDIAITNFSPSLATGSTPIASYSVLPSLPAGLSLNTTTGVISGTPTVAATSATYTVRATSAAACSSTYALTIEVSDNPPPVITGPNGTGTTTASTAAKSIPENTTAVGTYTANEAVTWSISGGADAALFSLNPSTGALSFNTAPKFATPTDADANNTYIVTVLATDNVGNTTTQTITVTVLLDSDGDTLPDVTDPDDDNDGLPDTDELDCSASTGVSNTVDPSPFYFVQWNSYVNGELKGTIDVAGTVVNVTVTNSRNSILQYRDNPYGGTADWGPTNINPFNSTFRSSTLGEHKFVFDRPVNNPRFFINSLNRTLDLSQPGIILKSNGRFTGTPTGTTTSVLVGNEAIGTISFNGNLTQVSFTGREFEMYCNFSLGLSSIADYSSCVDKDTDGDGLFDRLDIESDGDGVTDAQELADGTDYTDPCSFVLANQTLTPDAAWNAADCDGDGVTNLAEKNRGSNPLIADIAPVITGPNGNATTTGATSSKSVAENATAVVYTFTASKTVTWSLDGGEDVAKFSMNTTTGALTFLSAPDFEIPTDGSTSGTNTYIVVVKATDVYGLTKSQTLTVTVTNVNEVPTNIALSASSIAENNAANATVGNLSSTDVDAGDTHTYTLVNGDGSSDNTTFSISGTSLKVNTALNFEAKSSYSIRIRTTDAGGLNYEKQFTITVTNVNEAPTNISSTQTAIYEANAANATVGSLSSTDVDAGDTHTYSLVSGDGSTDNASFSISGNQLKANTVFVFNNQSTYSIRLRTTDAGGLSYEKVFSITVLESPFATGRGNVLGTSTITAASNNVTISKGYSAPLLVSGTGLVSYSWSPSTGLSSTNIANPIASPTQTTVYAVTVSNTMGLSTTVYVTVNVVEDYNITPNNVLTPNGDGVNDKWVIGNLSSYPNNQVQIFDRAGRLLYVQSNYQNEWDGTINGVPLNEDTYYFVINFGSGVNPKKGFITIVRQ